MTRRLKYVSSCSSPKECGTCLVPHSLHATRSSAASRAGTASRFRASRSRSSARASCRRAHGGVPSRRLRNTQREHATVLCQKVCSSRARGTIGTQQATPGSSSGGCSLETSQIQCASVKYSIYRDQLPNVERRSVHTLIWKTLSSTRYAPFYSTYK